MRNTGITGKKNVIASGDREFFFKVMTNNHNLNFLYNFFKLPHA